LLQQKEILIDEVMGPFLPGLACKPPILRRRGYEWRNFAVGCALRRIKSELSNHAQPILDQLQLLARRGREMNEPVEGLFGQHRRT
jgi:hypothetical protein